MPAHLHSTNPVVCERYKSANETVSAVPLLPSTAKRMAFLKAIRERAEADYGNGITEVEGPNSTIPYEPVICRRIPRQAVPFDMLKCKGRNPGGCNFVPCVYFKAGADTIIAECKAEANPNDGGTAMEM